MSAFEDLYIGALPPWLTPEFPDRKKYATPRGGDWIICPASSHKACMAAKARLDDWGFRWMSCASPGAFMLGVDLRVLLSVIVKKDQGKWLHVSYSYDDIIPPHDDTELVRELFMNERLPALSVWPSKEEYIDKMPYCLHLWQRLDARATPDFRSRGDI